MSAEHVHKLERDHTIRRQAARHETDDQPKFAAKQSNILSLQRLVGNQQVQRMLAQGTLPAPLQRCNCGGEQEEL